MTRREEINARLAEIRSQLEDGSRTILPDEQEGFEREVSALRAELEGMECRSRILDAIASGAGTVIESAPESVSGDLYSSPVYRDAWLNNLRGIELTQPQKRAFTSALDSAGHAIPTTTMDRIIEAVERKTVLLPQITMLHMRGNVKFAIESSLSEAVQHAENAAITPGTDTLTYVSLGGYEIVKQIQISETVRTMTISAFETWLIDMLSTMIARYIDKIILTGTGSSQPSGILGSLTFTVDVNKIEGDVTAEAIRSLIAMLPQQYDAEAKFIMTKRTWFTKVLPLQDDSKNSLVRYEGTTGYIHGYPVCITDNGMSDNSILFGDLKTVYGNLPQDIEIKGGYDTKTNSYIYNGVAMFDCKPALPKAFVLLAPLTEG